MSCHISIVRTYKTPAAAAPPQSINEVEPRMTFSGVNPAALICLENFCRFRADIFVLTSVAGVEFTGAPASSGGMIPSKTRLTMTETSQTTGGKVKDPSAPAIQEGTGKTEGSLAEESTSFGK
ncbi:hypothetical protein MRB53_039081 [Persea americana]|nr:hypothetical protein MRB53_039081 [Persea americana]